MKYRNLYPPFWPSGFRALLKWQVSDRFWGRRTRAPHRVAVPTRAPDMALLASDAPSLTWVGHATWIVRLGGLTVYTDPVWSPALSGVIRRNVAPGIALADAPRPDVVLVSHNHRDHLDAPTIDRIGPDATYVVPEGLGPFFRRRGLGRVVELAWWGEHVFSARGREIKISFVPSQHWSSRHGYDRNDTLWGGFVVEGGERRVYHSGDTAWFDGFAEIGRRFPAIDAAMLPIGAYDPRSFMRTQHMDPEDALRAFSALGARLLCAMHWGTFKLTDEPLDEPPRLLEELRAKSDVPAERVWVAAIGESRRL